MSVTLPPKFGHSNSLNNPVLSRLCRYKLTQDGIWPSAYIFNCDLTTEADIATMFCASESPTPISGSMLYTATVTGFGKGLRSVETYLVRSYDYSISPPTISYFSTTGTFVTTGYQTTGILWAMAVMVTSMVGLLSHTLVLSSSSSDFRGCNDLF